MRNQKQNTQNLRETEYSYTHYLIDEGSLQYSQLSQTTIHHGRSFVSYLQPMDSISNLLSEPSEDFYRFSENPSLQDEQSWCEADTTLNRIKNLLTQFPKSSGRQFVQPQESLIENITSHLQGEEKEECDKIQDEQEDQEKYKLESDEDELNGKDSQKSLLKEDSGLEDGGKSIFQYKFKMLTPDEQVSRNYQRRVFELPAPVSSQIQPLQLCSKVVNFNTEPMIQHAEREHHKSHLTDRSLIDKSSHSEFFIEPLNLKIGQSPVQIPNQQSSDGNRTDRSLYIKRPYFNDHNTFKIREFSDPNVDITQFYELKEKLYNLEEHKNNIIQQLREADNEIMRLREEKWFMKEMIDALQSQDNKKIIQLKQNLGHYEHSMNNLQNQTQNKDKQIQQLAHANHQLTAHLQHMSHYVNELQIKNQKLKLQYEEHKYSSFKQIEKLHEEIGEKEHVALDLEKQLEENQNDRKVENIEFEQMNRELKSQIEQLTKDIDTKKSQIQKLTSTKDELLKTIQGSGITKQSDEVDQLTIKRIYSSEFDKMKEELDSLELTRRNSEKQFTMENGKLKRELDEHLMMEQKYQSLLLEYEKNIKNLNEQLRRQENQFNLERQILETNFETQMSYFRKQLVNVKSELEVKNKKVKEQAAELRKLRKPNPGKIRIQFVDEKQSYVDQLKEIIEEYEQILQENQKTIKELQKKSHQFLSDAMQNQKELEKLQEERCLQKQELRVIYQEKKEIEYENRKMRSMIKESEKKIKAISRKMKIKNMSTSNEASTDHTNSQVIA